MVAASLTVPEVAEAAAVPVIDDIRGRVVEVYVSLKPGFSPSKEMKDKVSKAIETEIGKIARPKNVWIVPDRPKTRSGKITRRVIASVSNFADVGDVTTLANPEIVEDIRHHVQSAKVARDDVPRQLTEAEFKEIKNSAASSHRREQDQAAPRAPSDRHDVLVHLDHALGLQRGPHQARCGGSSPGMFRQIADQLWRRQGPGVRQLEANLARVIGPDATVMDLRRLSRDGMRSYLRYWLEVFRLPVIPPAEILGRMRAAGEEQTAFRHLAAGRGVIFALPHMGNWEHAGAWIVLRGAGKVTTVAEWLRPESLYDRFVAFRERLGMEVLPHSAGASRFGVLAQRLRAGGLVALLCERDLTGSGIEVEFFGEPARIMGGPAALAEQTGAALMPVMLWYEGENWGARIHPEIPVPETGTGQEKIAAMTQQLARVFEDGIARHPEDWHMLQKVFVADLGTGRLRAAGQQPPPAG